MSRERLDTELVNRGLVRSRASGRDLVRRGFVLVDGLVETKASRAVGGHHQLALADDTPRYVSRGAEKLVAGLARFGYPVRDLRIMDVGASTGGFTEVLLERDAQRVYAIDVGRGQLVASLAADARVVNLEGTDARRIDGTMIDAPTHGPADGLVCDVSFISLRKALSEPLMLVRRGGWAIALIKPQFEAGPDRVGSDGIVRDPTVHAQCVEDVKAWLATQSGWHVDGIIPSPIAGGSGNREFLIGARRNA